MSDVLAPLAFLFVATSTPPTGTQDQAFWFLGGLVALAVMANQVLSAVVSWRKFKGSDPGSDLRYCTKQDHQNLRDEVIGIKSDFSSLTRTINQSFNDLQRSIGRLEGKLDNKKTEGAG